MTIELKPVQLKGSRVKSGWEVEKNQKSSTDLGKILILFEACNNSGGNLQDTEQSIYVNTIEKSSNTENRHSVVFEKLIFSSKFSPDWTRMRIRI